MMALRTVMFISLQLAAYFGIFSGNWPETGIPRQKNNTGFADLEKRVKNEQEVPLDMFKKFIRLDRPELYSKQSRFTGKEVRYGANYTLFYIRQGDGQMAHEIIVSFNKQHEQVDAKAFLYFCDPCQKTRVAFFSFSGGKGNNDFNVRYYLSIGREMPDPDRIKIIKREKWHVSDEGKIGLAPTGM